MANAIFDDEYGPVVATLIGARRAAGVSQRQLGRKLGRSQSHICMIERRQRRVEIVEFCRIAQALGLEPEVLFARVARGIRGESDLRQVA